MIAYSHCKIHGVMAVKSNFNASWFKQMLIFLATTISQEFVAIVDNATTHKAKEVHKLLRSLKLWLVTIPPYNPHLNPCEKLIQVIKSMVRTRQKRGYMITLKTFQNVIDELDEAELIKTIVSSRQESLDLISDY
jgi:transposase